MALYRALPCLLNGGMKVALYLVLIAVFFLTGLAQSAQFNDCVKTLLEHSGPDEIIHLHFVFDGSKTDLDSLQKDVQALGEAMAQIPEIPRSPSLIATAQMRGKDRELLVIPVSAKRSAMQKLLENFKETHPGTVQTELAPENNFTVTKPLQ